MKKVNVDLHCHTVASPDGGLTETDIRKMLEIGSLDVIAVADHNVIHEAVRLQKIFGNQIIIGEEIMTTDGEIIGLFLEKVVQPGLSPKQTVEEIKKQNGIVYIPHPFEKARSGISAKSLDAIAKQVDIIEVINGRSFSKKAQKLAAEWAKQNNVAAFASSDAHGRIGWGKVHTELSERPSRSNLVGLAESGRVCGKKNGYISYLYPKYNKLRRHIVS